jgi:hypothetical protein
MGRPEMNSLRSYGKPQKDGQNACKSAKKAAPEDGSVLSRHKNLVREPAGDAIQKEIVLFLISKLTTQ